MSFSLSFFYISGSILSLKRHRLEKWEHGNSFITQSAALYGKTTALGNLYWDFGRLPHSNPCSQQLYFLLLKVMYRMCVFHRATTYYLADRRYDMLPSILSSDLCSLLGGVDRWIYYFYLCDTWCSCFWPLSLLVSNTLYHSIPHPCFPPPWYRVV